MDSISSPGYLTTAVRYERLRLLHSPKSQSLSYLQEEDVKEESTQCESVSVSEIVYRQVLKEHGKASNTAMSIKIKKEEEIRKSDSEQERRKKLSTRNPLLDDTMYEIRDLQKSARAKKKNSQVTPQPEGASPVGQVFEAGRFSTESVDQAEEDFAPPNAENFMANIIDIEYVTHDMVRNLTNTTDFPLPVAIEKQPPNFYMYRDLKSLEKQPIFGWQSLGANTFLSNVLCLPSEQEKDVVRTAVEKHKRVTILPARPMQAYRDMELLHTRSTQTAVDTIRQPPSSEKQMVEYTARSE